MRALLVGVLLVAAFGSASAGPARRIVSLAPHLTELAFTAGVGDRIVGTVEYSDHPDAAKQIARVGDAYRVDFERVLALQPDVVLAWESGTPVQTIERLRSLKMDVRTIATHRLSDVAEALRAIGEIAGVQERASAAASEYEAGIAALRIEYEHRAPLSVFVQVNDRPLYTINDKQIMSEVLRVCGGRNVFASLNELAPVVSIESVIAANPQVILATDDTVPDARAHWSRWRSIEAVRTGAVYTISSDDVARSTTRLVDGAREVCRTLDAARARHEKQGASR